MSRALTIAIDGPAGAGKSTIARRLAQTLGYAYLDSGAMYRCVALLASRAGVDPDDAESVVPLAEGARIAFAPGEPQRVLLDGEDVTDAIRTKTISQWASRVSVHGGVRRAMVARQQALGASGAVVMEGRDIGTVVFPGADLKLFLTASDGERARRRADERRAKGESGVDPAQVLEEIRERDRRDCTRADSPLRQADDAIAVITDGREPDEIVAELAGWARAREEG